MTLNKIILTGSMLALFLSCSKDKSYIPAEPFAEESFNIFPNQTSIRIPYQVNQPVGWAM